MNCLNKMIKKRGFKYFVFVCAAMVLCIMNYNFITRINYGRDDEVFVFKYNDTSNLSSSLSIEIDLIRSIVGKFNELQINAIVADPCILHNIVKFKNGFKFVQKEYKKCTNNFEIMHFISYDDLSVLKNVAFDNQSLLECSQVGESPTGSYVCVFLNTIVLLTKIEIKDTFLLSEGFTNTPKTIAGYIKGRELPIGQFKSAIDWFGTDKLADNLVVPKYHHNFVRQLENSRYISCNHSMAESFASLYPKLSRRNKKLEKMTVEYIQEMKKISMKFSVPFWIMSGITLGWYRQCGIISYTTDIDIGMHASNYSDRFFQQLKKSKLIRPTFSLGKPDDGYILRLNKSLDLCFFYESNERNNSYIAAYDFSKRSIYRSEYPKIKLCSTELLNQRVWVPCNPVDFLNAEYGKNWFHPKTDYNYLNANNLRFVKRYEKDHFSNLTTTF